MATLEVHDGQGRVQFVELEANRSRSCSGPVRPARSSWRARDQAGTRPDPLEAREVQGRGFARRRVRPDQRPQDGHGQHRRWATRSRSATAGSSCCGWTTDRGRVSATGPRGVEDGRTLVMPPRRRAGEIAGWLPESRGGRIEETPARAIRPPQAAGRPDART